MMTANQGFQTPTVSDFDESAALAEILKDSAKIDEELNTLDKEQKEYALGYEKRNEEENEFEEQRLHTMMQVSERQFNTMMQEYGKVVERRHQRLENVRQVKEESLDKRRSILQEKMKLNEDKADIMRTLSASARKSSKKEHQKQTHAGDQRQQSSRSK